MQRHAVAPRCPHGAVRAVLLPVSNALGCAHGAVRAVLMHVSWAVAPRCPHGAVRAVLLPVSNALGCMHGAVRAVLMHVSWAQCRAVTPRNAHCPVLSLPGRCAPPRSPCCG
jgi:hypothetical protein